MGLFTVIFTEREQDVVRLHLGSGPILDYGLVHVGVGEPRNTLEDRYTPLGGPWWYLEHRQ